MAKLYGNNEMFIFNSQSSLLVHRHGHCSLLTQSVNHVKSIKWEF